MNKHLYALVSLLACLASAALANDPAAAPLQGAAAGGLPIGICAHGQFRGSACAVAAPRGLA
jgi:hypothetical protein